ncbi:hypothetical protein EI555_017237, partial [Monodon monoceros]
MARFLYSDTPCPGKGHLGQVCDILYQAHSSPPTSVPALRAQASSLIKMKSIKVSGKEEPTKSLDLLGPEYVKKEMLGSGRQGYPNTDAAEGHGKNLNVNTAVLYQALSTSFLFKFSQQLLCYQDSKAEETRCDLRSTKFPLAAGWMQHGLQGPAIRGGSKAPLHPQPRREEAAAYALQRMEDSAHRMRGFRAEDTLEILREGQVSQPQDLMSQVDVCPESIGQALLFRVEKQVPSRGGSQRGHSGEPAQNQWARIRSGMLNVPGTARILSLKVRPAQKEALDSPECFPSAGKARKAQPAPTARQLEDAAASLTSNWPMFEDVFKFQAYTQQTLRACKYRNVHGKQGRCLLRSVPSHPAAIDTLCQVLFALNQTLLQHESVRAGSLQALYTTEDLIKHYNCGDLNAVIFNHDTSQLPNFINTTLPPHEQVTAQEIDSYFRQELIYKRNERMGKRVMTLLQENEDKICFFAFGAGLDRSHFLGNNTVIDVLRQAGLEVEHTPAGQTIHSPVARSPAPPPEGTSASPAQATPAAAIPAVPSAAPTAPPEEEDPALSPHLLLPDSLSQLEEFGRQKKWHKRQNKPQRPRQFNDLWVRIEDRPRRAPEQPSPPSISPTRASSRKSQGWPAAQRPAARSPPWASSPPSLPASQPPSCCTPSGSPDLGRPPPCRVQRKKPEKPMGGSAATPTAPATTSRGARHLMGSPDGIRLGRYFTKENAAILKTLSVCELALQTSWNSSRCNKQPNPRFLEGAFKVILSRSVITGRSPQIPPLGRPKGTEPGASEANLSRDGTWMVLVAEGSPAIWKLPPGGSATRAVTSGSEQTRPLAAIDGRAARSGRWALPNEGPRKVITVLFKHSRSWASAHLSFSRAQADDSAYYPMTRSDSGLRGDDDNRRGWPRLLHQSGKGDQLINPLQHNRQLRQRSQRQDARSRARSRLRLRPRAQGGAMGSLRLLTRPGRHPRACLAAALARARARARARASLSELRPKAPVLGRIAGVRTLRRVYQCAYTTTERLHRRHVLAYADQKLSLKACLSKGPIASNLRTSKSIASLFTEDCVLDGKSTQRLPPARRRFHVLLTFEFTRQAFRFGKNFGYIETRRSLGSWNCYKTKTCGGTTLQKTEVIVIRNNTFCDSFTVQLSPPGPRKSTWDTEGTALRSSPSSADPDREEGQSKACGPRKPKGLRTARTTQLGWALTQNTTDLLLEEEKRKRAQEEASRLFFHANMPLDGCIQGPDS